MIAGFVEMDMQARAVHTHRDSYLLDTLTVVSVRRPFLAGGLMFGLGFSGFTAMFSDLLYAHEMVLIPAGALALALGAWHIGQLKLLSRDLRGSELTGVIWGHYGELNKIRRDIINAMSETMPRAKPDTPSQKRRRTS